MPPMTTNSAAPDLNLILTARQQNPHLVNIREYVRNWYTASRQNKDLKDRRALASEELKKSDAVPIVAQFIEQRGNNAGQNENVRNNLLKPEVFNTLNERAADTCCKRRPITTAIMLPATSGAIRFASMLSTPRSSPLICKLLTTGWKRPSITASPKIAKQQPSTL